MSLISADALVLQTFRYSESSKILRLLTRTHGVRSAMARGALRPKSRYGGILEPFTGGVASLILKDGRDLHTLTGFDLVRLHRGLGEDLLRFGGASFLGELVIRTGSEEADPTLYSRVLNAFDRLETANPEELEPVILTEAWAIATLLGFEPEVHHCVRCGRWLEEDEGGRFEFAAGGVRCEGCDDDAPGPRLPAHALSALRLMVSGESAPLPETAGHWALLLRFLRYHVLQGGRLRSLDFLASVVPAIPKGGEGNGG